MNSHEEHKKFENWVIDPSELWAVAVKILAQLPRSASWSFVRPGGYHHSIAVGIPAIEKLGAAHHLVIDTAVDASKFTMNNLK